jgi:hypothetical protein
MARRIRIVEVMECPPKDARHPEGAAGVLPSCRVATAGLPVREIAPE